MNKGGALEKFCLGEGAAGVVLGWGGQTGESTWAYDRRLADWTNRV